MAEKKVVRYLPMTFLVPQHLTRIDGGDVGNRFRLHGAFADDVWKPRRLGAAPVIRPQHDPGVLIGGSVEDGVGVFDRNAVAVEK